MSKRRKKIRNEVIDLLKRARVVDTRQIRASRSIVYEESELPAISVYTREEEVVERSQAPREGRRNLNMVIEVLVSDSDDSEASDTLDDLLEKIEDTLTFDDTIDCSADDVILQRINFDYEGENFDRPVHSAQMVWLVKYRDFFPRDDRFAEDNLSLVHADWDFAPPDGDIEAEDDVDIPTT